LKDIKWGWILDRGTDTKKLRWTLIRQREGFKEIKCKLEASAKIENEVREGGG